VSRRVVLTTILAVLAAAAPAQAVTIQVSIVGPGRVVDTRYTGQIDCTAPENTPATAVTTCSKDYNAFSGPIFQALVPAGWNGGQRFVQWDQPRTGEIDCDDEPLSRGICTFGTGLVTGTMHVTARFTDTTAPPVAVTGGPSGRVNTTAATFAISSPDDVARFECSRDAAAFLPCGSTVTYTNLSQGMHSFAARAIDPSDNATSLPPRTWIVDTVAPTATIVDGPSGIVGEGSASFTFSANEPGASFFCQLDTRPAGACSSPQAYADLADGGHTFRVFANDGLQSGPSAVRAWTVDTTVAQTTLLSAPDAVTAAAVATFTFGSSAAPARFQCRLDGPGGHDWQDCTSPKSYSGLLDGTRIFAVRALNSAGTPDPSASQFTFRIDRTAPETSAAGDALSGFTFAASEGDVSYSCSVDGGAAVGCQSPFIPPAGLAPGGHTLDVRATDAAGNSDLSPARVTWVVPAASTGLPSIQPPAIVQPPATVPPPVIIAQTPRLTVTLSFFMRAGSRSTRFSRLSVVGVPAGATVRVSCKGARCPKKTFTSKRSGAVTLTPFRTTLRVGVKLTVLVTKPGTIGAAKTLTVRKSKAPLIGTQCVAVGASKPSKC